MPSQATLDRVKTIVREALKISPDAVLDDHTPLMGGQHDFDSLDLLLIVTTIERDFKIKIPDRTVGRQVFQSVYSLADYVDGQQP